MSIIEESRRRIVDTGVGSLPRRDSLSDLLLARLTKQPYDAAALTRETTEAVVEVVNKQIALGVDIISDGEQSKTSFQNYIADRLTGLEPITPKPGDRKTRENAAFHKLAKSAAAKMQRVRASGKLCVADIAEYNPSLDQDKRTARAAARLAYRLL